MATERVKCGRCEFWLKTKDLVGDCRLHPPQLNQEQQMWEFPQTKRDSWCADGVQRTTVPEGKNK